MHADSIRRSPSRLVFAALGWCAVAMAVAGVLLPGLPTTVFVLLASWCFSKSSPRFSRWLRENRWLGPVLDRYAAAGGLTAGAKRAALYAMWTSVLLSAAMLSLVRPAIAAAVLLLGVAGTFAILFAVRTVPEARR